MDDAQARPFHHHGRLREAVLELAVAEARLGSIDSLSMRDVSRRLGVSPAAVYRHFSDRDAILRAVAQAGFDLLAASFEDALPFASQARDAADAVRRYQALAVAYVAFAREHYGLWRLMFGPYGRNPDGPQLTRPSTYEWLGKSLAELEHAGLIGPVTGQSQYFIWAAIHGVSDLQTSPTLSGASPDAVARTQAMTALRALDFTG